MLGLARVLAWTGALLAITGSATAQTPPERTVFTNATIVDVRTGEGHPGSTVVVEGNQIVSVGPASAVSVPRGARVIDASGQYLMPGLIDTHVHLNLAWLRPAQTDTLSLLRWILAGGVTTIRDAASPRFESNYAAVRARNEAGAILSPRIVIAQGVWAGQRYGTSTLAATIERLRVEGVNQIKVLPRSRAAALEVIEAARAAGVPVFGHTDAFLPDSTKELFTMAAVRAGISGLTHITQVYASAADSAVWLDGSPGATVAGELEALRHWITGTEAAWQELIDSMVARRTWLEPTLSILESHDALQGVCARGYDVNAVRRYLPWWEEPAPLEMTAVQRDSLRTACGRMTSFVRRFWEAGGTVIAGTDLVPSPPLGVVYEVEWLVRAGLPPLAAIQAATLNAAAALGLEAEVGSVEPGKRADLLLLDADPLQDVANLRRMRMVVANGRVLDRSALDALLEPPPSRR